MSFHFGCGSVLSKKDCNEPLLIKMNYFLREVLVLPLFPLGTVRYFFDLERFADYDGPFLCIKT